MAISFEKKLEKKTTDSYLITNESQWAQRMKPTLNSNPVVNLNYNDV